MYNAHVAGFGLDAVLNHRRKAFTTAKHTIVASCGHYPVLCIVIAASGVVLSIHQLNGTATP
jgi:hypothetical protein